MFRVIELSYIVFELLGDELTRKVKIIDQAVGLIHCTGLEGKLLHHKRSQPKVKYTTLSFLQTDRWEVSDVRPCWYVLEGNPEKLIISPVHNFTKLEVNQRSNDVAHDPVLTPRYLLTIPFAATGTIVSIRGMVITYAICRPEYR